MFWETLRVPEPQYRLHLCFKMAEHILYMSTIEEKKTSVEGRAEGANGLQKAPLI